MTTNYKMKVGLIHGLVCAIGSCAGVYTYGVIAFIFSFIPRILVSPIGVSEDSNKYAYIAVLFIVSSIYYVGGVYLAKALLKKLWLTYGAFWFIHLSIACVIAVNVLK